MLSRFTVRDLLQQHQETLHNAGARQKKDAEKRETAADLTALWFDELSAHYAKLSLTNDERRTYLTELIGADCSKPPKGKFCTLPDHPEGLTKGETETLLAERTGMTGSFLRNRGYNARKRPERASAVQMMDALEIEGHESREAFLARFGWALDKASPTDRAGLLKDKIAAKWPGVSWDRLTADGYIPLSGSTMDNVKTKEHLDQSTAYAFIIALGSLCEADKDRQTLYRAFGLAPLSGGEADGAADVCMRYFDPLIRQMAIEYRIPQVHALYWETLRAVLASYDKRHSQSLFGLIFSGKPTGEERAGALPDVLDQRKGGIQ